MDRDSLMSIIGVAITLAIALILVGGLLLLARSCSKTRCETYAEELNTDYRYDFTSGCRLKVKGRFVPRDNLRLLQDGELQVEKEGA